MAFCLNCIYSAKLRAHLYKMTELCLTLSVLKAGLKWTSCRSAATFLWCCAQTNMSSHSTGLIVWVAVPGSVTSGLHLIHVWITSNSGRVISCLSPSVHSVRTSSVWKSIFKLYLKNRFSLLSLPACLCWETVKKPHQCKGWESSSHLQIPLVPCKLIPFTF